MRSTRYLAAAAAISAMASSAGFFGPMDGLDTITGGIALGQAGPPVGRGKGKGHKQHLRKIKALGGPKRQAKKRRTR